MQLFYWISVDRADGVALCLPDFSAGSAGVMLISDDANGSGIACLSPDVALDGWRVGPPLLIAPRMKKLNKCFVCAILLECKAIHASLFYGL